MYNNDFGMCDNSMLLGKRLKVLISCLRTVRFFSNYICRWEGNGERRVSLQNKIHSLKVSYLYLIKHMGKGKSPKLTVYESSSTFSI